MEWCQIKWPLLVPNGTHDNCNDFQIFYTVYVVYFVADQSETLPSDQPNLTGYHLRGNCTLKLDNALK